jgi:ADP-heptose:LPS heptosyltransferase
MKIAVCTIASLNYLPQIQTLKDSLRKWAPDWDQFTLFGEDPVLREKISPYHDNFLLPDEIEAPRWREMAFSYDCTEFNTSIKPFLMRTLLKRGYDAVFYFDPDIEVYSSLKDLETWISQYDAVLTPHITKPYSVEEPGFPRNEDFIRVGQFNLGFLGLRRSVETLAFLDWWAGCLETKCLKEGTSDYFVDQFWASAIPSFIRSTKIIHNEGYNFAYWNLPQRSLSRSSEGWATKDGPLVFFHFSGLIENDVGRISRHQKKYSVEQGSDLYSLLQDYANGLIEKRKSLSLSKTSYSFAHYTDGSLIDLQSRRNFLMLSDDQKASIGNPFERKEELPFSYSPSTDLKTLQKEAEVLRGKLAHILTTPSWRIGRFITWPARKIRRALTGNHPLLRFFFLFQPHILLHYFLSFIYFVKHAVTLLSIRSGGKKIIAINLVEHLGDIVAAEPISRFIREKNPDAFIIWYVRKPYLELVAANPVIDCAAKVPCDSIGHWLKRVKLLSELVEPAIADRLCSVCKRAPRSRNITEYTMKNYYHHGHLLSVFSKSAGLPELNEAPRLQIDGGTQRKIDEMGLPEKYLVMHCKSNETSRDWPVEKWEELIEGIRSRWNLPIIEVGMTQQIPSSTEERTKNLCGKLSILETAEVIRRAALFVGVDSGPAQLANAVGTKGVILLGTYRSFTSYLPYSGNYQAREFADILRANGPVAVLPIKSVLDSIARQLRVF